MRIKIQPLKILAHTTMEHVLAPCKHCTPLVYEAGGLEQMQMHARPNDTTHLCRYNRNLKLSQWSIIKTATFHWE